MSKKVEILGCGLTCGVVPGFDPAAERWGLNALAFTRFSGQFDNWTRWFDLHGSGHIQRERPQSWGWYQQQAKPIYRWSVDLEMPASVAYPRDDVQRAFGRDGQLESDFEGSVSWMIALAVLEGFDAIDLFWCPFNAGHESQVPSVRYWIGRARGSGIAVTVHGDSLVKPGGQLYGVNTA